MKLPRRQFLQLVAGAGALSTASRVARAQSYPSRPITITVPFAAGGATDVIARIFAERMRVSLGQTVVVENVSGAAGVLGVSRVARAPADGYTISIGHWGTHVVNSAVYTLQFDVLNDLEPVALLPSNPYFIVTNNAVPATNLKGVIEWLKANPGKASAATAGAGSAPHVIGVNMQNVTGTRFDFVPYRGDAPAIQDMIAAHIDLYFPQAAVALPYVQSGTIRAYAVTAKSRLATAPNIPTVDEAGLPGFYVSAWHGLWVPKGTPKDIIAKLNAAAVDTMADPNVRQRLADIGLPSRDQQAPQVLGALQRAEANKWWPIIKAAGIKAE